MRFYLRANRRSRVTVGITAVIVAMLSLATIALATQQILSAGPLTRVLVPDQLNRTDVALSNSGGAGQNVIVYRAADCYLQNSDSGYGRVDAATHAVACTTGTTPTSRIEQWFPLTPGSHYYQAGYYEVWARIGSQL